MEVKVSAPRPRGSGKPPAGILRGPTATALGRDIIKTITDRVAKGEGLDGRPFAPYRTPSKLGQQVDLRETGNMLNTLTATITSPTQIRISTSADYVRYVDELRPFMGLTDKELSSLGSTVEKLIDEFLTRIGQRR